MSGLKEGELRFYCLRFAKKFYIECRIIVTTLIYNDCMKFRIILSASKRNCVIPMNYSYPLSAAIYKILQKADTDYAAFLHETGYGKGFKLFTFSQINCPFNIEGDRMKLLNNTVSFETSFHLPEASQNFIKGLFLSQQIDIADKKSKATFTVASVESLPNPLQSFKENEIISVQLQPISPVVAGVQNEKGNYDFLSPGDTRFSDHIIYNWRSKIATCYDEPTATNALLIIEVSPLKKPPKSRLITIKANTPAETKIRGWMNFGLKVTGEKRFVEILMNAGVGLYNAQGMGMLEVIVE